MLLGPTPSAYLCSNPAAVVRLQFCAFAAGQHTIIAHYVARIIRRRPRNTIRRDDPEQSP